MIKRWGLLLITMVMPGALYAAGPTITNLGVTAMTGSSVTIQWTTSATASAQLLYGVGNLNSKTPVLPASGTSQTITITGLQVGLVFSYAAVSTSAGGTTTSTTQQFELCDANSAVNVSGTVNNYYEYAPYTLTWTNQSGQSGSNPTLCGKPLVTPTSGLLDPSGTFSQPVPNNLEIVPSPSAWTFAATGTDNSTGAMSATFKASGQSTNINAALAAGAAGNYQHVWYDPSTGSFNPTGGVPPPGWTCTGSGSSQVCTAPGTLAAGTLAAGTAVTARQIGAIRYASQYQTGGGNNGIANAAAANQLVIADPGYANTENPTPYSFSVSPFHYQDLRNGMNTHFFHNPLFGGANPVSFNFNTYPANPGNSPTMFGCLYDKSPASWVGANVDFGCTQFVHIRNFPGWQIGNPPGFGAGAGNGWTQLQPMNIVTTDRGKGITIGIQPWQTKLGTGDNAGIRAETLGDGGLTGASDEGNETAFDTIENQASPFNATCLTGCTPGSQSITTGVANGDQGAGRYLISTAHVSTGNLTAIAGGLGGASAYTVDATVPVSTAWGQVASAINTPVVPNSPFTTSETFTVIVSSGTFVTSTAPSGPTPWQNLICFSGNFHETAVVTAVGAVSGGNQSVTAALRMPHATGYVFQGGVCGSGIEIPYFTYNELKYLFDVVGSTDSHTLQAVKFIGGGGALPNVSTLIVGNITISNALASSGTTVTVPITGGSIIGGLAFRFPGVSYLISGASDSALNDVCTNMQFLTSSQVLGTCTIAGLSGTHTTTTTATATLYNSAISQGAGYYKMSPMAEVTDVQNNSTNPPTVDGTLVLEPNIIPFATSDAVLIPHMAASNWQGGVFGNFVEDPYALSQGIYINDSGMTGGGASTSANSYIRINASTAATELANTGGVLSPPNILESSAPYTEGIVLDRGPLNGEKVLFVETNTAQKTNPTYAYYAGQLDGNSGGFSMIFTPFTNNMLIQGTGTTAIGGGGFNVGTFTPSSFNGTVAFTNTTTAPTQSCASNTNVATGAYVANCGTPLNSPAFTGTPTAPTASPGTNTTQVATAAFVQTATSTLAPLASPALTATPTAPTASPGTNTTQLATTAFVAAGTTSRHQMYWNIQSALFSTVTALSTAYLEDNAATLKAITARLSGAISCTVAPTIAVLDLGTSITTVYGSATVLASLSTGTSDGAFTSTGLSNAIAAGHYVGIGFSAGTCITAPTMDISAEIQ